MTRIRPRLPADLPACAAALRGVHEASGYPSRWPDDPVGWLTPRGQVGAWVAWTESGEVLGHVALRRGDAKEAAPAWAVREGPDAGALAYVARLFVVPRGRGGGVGAALLEEALTHARAQGWRAVLEVDAGAEAAIRLYERRGWRRVATGAARWRNTRGEHPPMHVYLSPLS